MCNLIFNLKTAVRDGKVMQDFESESCINLPSPTAIFRFKMNRFLPLLLSAPLLSYSEEQVNKQIEKLQSDMRQIRAETAYENFGAKTASANAPIDGYGFFGSLDLLVWKLYEGGTDYLLEDKFELTASPVKGNIKQFNFDWAPGFRVGLGYLFEHDGWDTDLELTYFATDAENKVNGPHLFPLVGDETLSLVKARGKWDVEFYNIDLALGRNYFVSKYLSLRPFFAIASTWIDQDRRFHFVREANPPVKLKSENDFWGMGPKIGLNSQFFFGTRLSFYADVAADLLWGSFHIKEKETPNIYAIHYPLHRMVPNLFFGLGAGYEKNISDHRYHLLVKVGYENQYFFRQNQLPIFDQNIPNFHKISEDLSMQGFTLHLRLDF